MHKEILIFIEREIIFTSLEVVVYILIYDATVDPAVHRGNLIIILQLVLYRNMRPGPGRFWTTKGLELEGCWEY